MKYCKKCNLIKSKKEFHKNKTTKDKLQTYCKKCLKAYATSDQGRENFKKYSEKLKKNGYYIFGAGRLRNLKFSAKRRNLSFELTEQQLKTWWHNTENKCQYCGITTVDFLKIKKEILEYKGTNPEVTRFKHFFKAKTHRNIEHMTIDRIENDQGYSISNIVKSCWICNSLKGHFWTYTEMKELSPKFIGDLILDLNLSITLSQ